MDTLKYYPQLVEYLKAEQARRTASWEQAPPKSPKHTLGPIGNKHFSLFLQKGLPTGAEKQWKFSSIQKNLRSAFQSSPTASGAVPPPPGAVPLKPLVESFPNEQCIHFQNGCLQNSSLKEFLPADYKNNPSALQWCRLPNVTAHFPNYRWLADNMHAQTKQGDGLSHLANALPLGGYVLFVPKGFKSDVPLHIKFRFDLSLNKPVCNIRNFIFIEEGARLTLVESVCSEYTGLVNTVLSVQLSKNACLNRIKINQGTAQSYCVSSTFFDMGERSRLDDMNVNVSAGFCRNRADVLHAAEKARSALLGLSPLKGRALSDHRFYIQHLKPGGYSRQFYRGVLDDFSQSIFHGKIDVSPSARHTDCGQSAKNLLLSDRAYACIQPELAMACGFVKAHHGASAGQLSEDEIFYLQSRGLDKKTALEFLIFAYIKEVLAQFPNPDLIKHLNACIAQNKTLLLNC